MPELSVRKLPVVDRRLRCVIYTLLIAALAAVMLFYRLDDGTLNADAARFGVVVDHMRATGDWLHPTYNDEPYLHKPPVYMWLTALTYDLLGGHEFKYRFWAAVFGFGCALMTLALGARLFTPEVGLIGAALLMLNRAFLLSHGARAGVTDSAVALGATVSVCIAWVLVHTEHRWRWWAALGAATGVMGLFKPFIGVPLLLLCFVFLLRRREGAARQPWPAALMALGLCVLPAAAWYAYLGCTVDGVFGEAIVRNLYVRAVEGIQKHQIQPGAEVLENLGRSVFAPALPLLLVGLILSWWGPRRLQYALVCRIALVWIVGLMLFKSKLSWYYFTVAPLIAIAMAAVGVEALAWAGRRLPGRLRTAGIALVAAGLAGGAGWSVAEFIRRGLDADLIERMWSPWTLYEFAQQPGNEDIAFIRLAHIRPNAQMRYYRPRMVAAIDVHSHEQFVEEMDKHRCAVIGSTSALRFLQPELEAVEQYLSQRGGVRRFDTNRSISYTVGLNQRLPEHLLQASRAVQRVPATAPAETQPAETPEPAEPTSGPTDAP